jgi:hypothetical protein
VTFFGTLLGSRGVEFEGPFAIRVFDVEVAAIIADGGIESNWQMGGETAFIEDHLMAGMDH